jgi:hypothetical protein
LAAWRTVAAKRATYIMETGFLSKDEVAFLTGYKHCDKQAEWLAREGIRFHVSRDDSVRNGHKSMKCVVSWTAFNERR